MNLSEDLAWRGLIKDKTFESDKWLDKPRKFYLGIDASSDSLTIGNLAVIMLARRLAEAGWAAVLLAGGATSLVGDPGGKDEERNLKAKAEIAKNIDGVEGQIEKLFAGQKHQMVNNLDWLGELKYLDFLRDVGKHYPMSELMQREFVNARMNESGSGISYAEFSYSLLQGYDFWWLFNNKGVEMQIGASDQWGNILSGVALIRKKEAKEVHALCMPLVINKATGKKFGKSESGAIWLDAKRTSPYRFYQFWYNIADDEVADHLKVFTLIKHEEFEPLIKQQAAKPAERIAQKKLAYEVTALVHGNDQAKKQEHIAQALFGGGDVSELNDSELATVREELPSAKVQPGTPVIEVLVKTGLASSNSEARRLAQSQAVYVDNQSFNKDHLEANDFKRGRLLLRRGKAYKDSALVELAQ
ncbi:tyrosine--tRNA ligase [Candidatus Saccharibacteria bacterium]|nr:tyrosine--tRNA ligase [Candidatus Saccharibacteria bacterium]